MRDVLQTPRARRTYGVDRSGGATIIYADPADPCSGRVWARAIPPHLSPCRIDAGKGLAQHRCSATHADVITGYRAWRDSEYAAAEEATHAYGTELTEYWTTHARPTFRDYLTGTRRTRDARTDI